MGNNPDYEGPGISIWMNKTREGKEYATVQLFGKGGIRIPCFPYEDKEQFVTEYRPRAG